MAQPPGQHRPAVPVVLIQAVLNADDGVLGAPGGVQIRQFGGGQGYPFARQFVAAGSGVPEFRGGHIQGDIDLLAGAVAGGFNGAQHHRNGVPVGGQGRGKAALVAHIEVVAASAQDGLQRLVDFHAGAQGIGKAVKAGGRDHKFLNVGGVGGVPPAVEDVQQRHGQGNGTRISAGIGSRAGQVAPEGTAGRRCRRGAGRRH